MIRLAFLLLSTVLYLIFMVYNQDEKVILHYTLGLSTQPISLHILVLGAIVSGLILGVFLFLPTWFNLRGRLKNQRRTIEWMEDELDRLAPPTSKKRIAKGYADPDEDI